MGVPVNDREKKGCAGVLWILITVGYLAAYEIYGVDGYVYSACTLGALLGMGKLLAAAFIK